MANSIVFIATAVGLCLLLSMVVIAVWVLRRRWKNYPELSTKGECKKLKKESMQPAIPMHGFIVPTSIPSTVSYVNTIPPRRSRSDISEDMIDPELYKGVKKRELSSSLLPGKLCFSVQYQRQKEKLIVGVIRGQRIRGKTSNPTSIPLVKICLLPDKRKKLQTKTRQKTPHPVFNEEFVFHCPCEELRQRTLRFSVFEFDRFSRDSPIGTVIFSLDDNYENILTEEGCIEVWRDIEDLEGENISSGKILFSLQYLPTAERLAVLILQGKDLSVEGNTKNPSVYVKITMTVGGKKIRSQKTSKKPDFDPIFNESFHFDVPGSILDRTSFVMAVMNNNNLNGQVVVGPFMYATGTGLSHWNDMLAAPRNAVEMWHSLC